tara:strand:- start:756 stop:1331 length:576 start_codon:yes stop_codon:yes gene_type:complete
MSAKILAFAGSARRDSFNKKLVRIAARGAEAAGAEVTLIDLADFPMPIFDGDLEAGEGIPEKARELRGLMLAHNALLIAAPEYNSGITPLLKNAIDWTSRPDGDVGQLAAYGGKVAALVSASPGALGGLRGLFHVRYVLSNIRVTVLPDQVAVGQSGSSFDAAGELSDDARRQQVEAVGAALAKAAAKLHG